MHVYVCLYTFKNNRWLALQSIVQTPPFLFIICMYGVCVCTCLSTLCRVHAGSCGDQRSMSVSSYIVFHLMPFTFYFSCVTLNAQHHNGYVEVDHRTTWSSFLFSCCWGRVSRFWYYMKYPRLSEPCELGQFCFHPLSCHRKAGIMGVSAPCPSGLCGFRGSVLDLLACAAIAITCWASSLVHPLDSLNRGFTEPGAHWWGCACWPSAVIHSSPRLSHGSCRASLSSPHSLGKHPTDGTDSPASLPFLNMCVCAGRRYRKRP